jgi:hypothetical protein
MAEDCIATIDKALSEHAVRRYHAFANRGAGRDRSKLLYAALGRKEGRREGSAIVNDSHEAIAGRGDRFGVVRGTRFPINRQLDKERNYRLVFEVCKK